MFLEVSFGTDDTLGRDLGLFDGLEQILDFLLDVLDSSGFLVEAVDPLVDLVYASVGTGSCLVDDLEALVRLRELVAAYRDLCQHFAERAAFLSGRVDERLEFFRR